jgi:N-formylglutamate amidohydrolase
VVPGIQPEPFPQLILGDNDGTSASAEVIKTAWAALQNSGYQAEHNHPFKGGHITRYFGKPQKNVHALQLEMTKTNYMDANETQYSDTNAEAMREVLTNMFTQLIKTLQS